MRNVLTDLFVIAALIVTVSFFSYDAGYTDGQQDPLGAYEDVQECQVEYKTACAFQVVVYPVEQPEVELQEF